MVLHRASASGTQPLSSLQVPWRLLSPPDPRLGICFPPLTGQQRESTTSLVSFGIQSEWGQQAGGDEAETGERELLSKTHKLVPERNGASFLPISSLPQPLPGKQHEGLGWSKTQAWVWGMALGQLGLPFRRPQRLRGPAWARPPQGTGLELGALDPR